MNFNSRANLVENQTVNDIVWCSNNRYLYENNWSEKNIMITNNFYQNTT